MERDLTFPNAPSLHWTVSKQHRFHFLDALRGIAAFLIVLWHAPPYLLTRGGTSTFLAVDFFFCLSGFVIAFSYERRLAETMSFLLFAKARVIRLFPIYILGTVVGLFAFVFIAPAPRMNTGTMERLLELFLMSLLMLPDKFAWHAGILFPLDFPSWSLFYELSANLAFGLLVKKHLARTSFVLSCALLSFLILFTHIAQGGTLDVGWQSALSMLYLGIARVTLSFSLGVLLLRLSRSRPKLHVMTEFANLLPAFLTVSLIFLLMSPFKVMRLPFFHLFLVTFLFPSVVFLGALAQVPAKWVRLCVFLGDVSYPLYLLHAPIIAILYVGSVIAFAGNHLIIAGILFPFTLALTTVIAHSAFIFYDIPLRNWLRRHV